MRIIFKRNVMQAGLAILISLTIFFSSACSLKQPAQEGVSKMDFDTMLDALQRNSIIVDYEASDGKELPVGCSKLGGKPDLPSDFEWYYFKGESYDGITENRPLSFLAQINCAEAKALDQDDLLPSGGMLYFFYELETMTWGFDPKDKGSARVYYYPGDIQDLQRTEFPEDLSDEYKLPEMAIRFSQQKDWPDYEEFVEWHNEVGYDAWEAYDKVLQAKGAGEPGLVTKLLGYADLVQGGMLLQCEEVANGIYTGDNPDIAPDKLEKYKEDCVQWRLLFQMDSIQDEAYEILWGDFGRIYFYIREDDLRNLNFEDCWLILQCT